MNQITKKIFQFLIVLMMLLFHTLNLSEASSTPSINVNFTNVKFWQITKLISSITGKNYVFNPINNREKQVTIFAKFSKNDSTQFLCLVLETCGLTILNDGETIVPLHSDDKMIQVLKNKEIEILNINNSVEEKEVDINSLLSMLISDHDNSMKDSVSVKPGKVMIKDGDIHNFIWLASEITGKNLVANHQVIGNVSLDIPYPVTQKEFYQLFLNTLQRSGYKTVNTGMFLKIEKK